MLNDEAASQPMVMLVAALVFAAAVGLLLSEARDRTEADAPLAQPVRAADVAALLVDSAGLDSAGTRLSCAEVPDSMGRFGIRGDGSPSDGTCKIRHLQAGNVSYDDVLDAFGFPEDHGLHIRFQPVLDDLERMQARGRLGLHVAYVGEEAEPEQVEAEVAVLEQVVREVSIYNATAWPGMGLCEHQLCLDTQADAFDAMVIGTGVDHVALGQIFSVDVAYWFTFAPRTLIVFPSPMADQGWLSAARAQAKGWDQAPYHVNNHPLAEPDAGHMLLHVPNRLAWRGYETASDLHPIVDGFPSVFHAVGDPSDPIAHIPAQRAFGAGQLFFVHTSLAAPGGPPDPGVPPLLGAPPPPDDEAQRLLHNLLARHDQHLWLDFGGTAPTSASSTIRWSEVESPDLYTRHPSTQAVRVHVHVFQDASQDP